MCGNINPQYRHSCTIIDIFAKLLRKEVPMNKKTDRRTLYTQSVIKDAFIKLLQRKHIGKITVTEICKLAEINRATFYIHYHDPYDLMEKLEAEQGAKLVEALSKLLQGDAISAHIFDLPQHIRNIIHADEVTALLYLHPSANGIQQYLFDGLAAILEPRFISWYGFTKHEAHAVFTFVFSGYYAMDRYLHDSKPTPVETEKIKGIIAKMVGQGLEPV